MQTQPSKPVRPPLTRADWLIPASLIALALVPTIAGVVRLITFALGLTTMPNHARLAASPLPVIVHIVTSLPFFIVGAFQFSPGLRRRNSRWHRAAGRILAPLGMMSALSGLWMTLFYRPGEDDSWMLVSIRIVVASSMITFIGAGLLAVRRRDFAAHGRWMTRGYALGAAAGTQLFTMMPYALFEALHNPAGRALLMGAGWALNLAVAEWALRRRVRGVARASTRSPLIAPVLPRQQAPAAR